MGPFRYRPALVLLALTGLVGLAGAGLVFGARPTVAIATVGVTWPRRTPIHRVVVVPRRPSLAGITEVA